MNFVVGWCYLIYFYFVCASLIHFKKVPVTAASFDHYTPSFIQEPPTPLGVARGETEDRDQDDTLLGYGLFLAASLKNA